MWCVQQDPLPGYSQRVETIFLCRCPPIAFWQEDAEQRRGNENGEEAKAVCDSEEDVALALFRFLELGEQAFD